MKTLLVCIVALPILASSAFGEVWPSENLLQNPGLEGKDSDGAPHWLLMGTGEMIAEKGKDCNGTRAVKLSTGEGTFGLQADKIVLPHTTVEVSFEIKVKQEGSSPVYAAINWYADKSLVGTNAGKPLDDNTDWCALPLSSIYFQSTAGMVDSQSNGLNSLYS